MNEGPRLRRMVEAAMAIAEAERARADSAVAELTRAYRSGAADTMAALRLTVPDGGNPGEAARIEARRYFAPEVLFRLDEIAGTTRDAGDPPAVVALAQAFERYGAKVRKLAILDLAGATDAEIRAAWEAEASADLVEQHAMLDLLAVIHRDGGHHTDAVGFIQSCRDAIDKWTVLRTQRDEAARVAGIAFPGIVP